MRVFADDMNPDTIILSIEHELSRAEDESTTYPVSIINATTPSSNGKSSQDEDEIATRPVGEKETEAEDGSPTYLINTINAILSENDGNPSETEDESAKCALGGMETEAHDEYCSYAVTKPLIETILKRQTEETRLNLVDIAEDTGLDLEARYFAEATAAIVEWWQYYAGEENPTSFEIDFGVGSRINLLMVLALLPEKYQCMIRIGDEHRSPSGDGENLSWLHEQTMDVLAGLSMDPVPNSMLFGRGLASMIRDDVDEGWRSFTGRSWLEDQIHLWSNNELEPDLYRFPPETDKIIFFFNPTEIHWTVVEVDLADDVWTYTLFDSLCLGEKGATWKACEEQFPLLEQLICRASGFAEPTSREIVLAPSAQQENAYDCGPIAIYNAVERCDGRAPATEIDANDLRLGCLEMILEALCLLDEGLETSVFRARMRESYSN